MLISIVILPKKEGFGEIKMLNNKKSLFCKRLLTLFVFLSVFCFFGISVDALTADDYAPILYFESKETCYPVSVEYFLDNSVNSSINITLNGESNLLSFYDNTLGTINDKGVISDYKIKLENNDPSVDYTVYYQINTSSGTTYIQYWMFYVFNEGEHNQHEGDWEMVQIAIPNAGQKWVAYSQHYSGQKATWDIVEKDGDNFKVYVARGSHANYLRSYSGKLGIASDILGDNGKVLKPDDYNLVELDSQTWIDFQGLWGEVNSIEDFFMGQAGPQGPKYRTDMSGSTKMWDGISWGSNLMQANDSFFMIEWFLYNFISILVVIFLISLGITFFRIYRRYKKRGLGPRIVSMLYLDGLNLHTIGNILCFVGIVIAIIGLFGNWYAVSADINIDVYPTSGMTNIITLNGINGMQVFMPSLYGPIPMGSVVFPFSFVILIGFIFMVLATIGVYKSSKLGLKYIFKGIRLILIIVILLASLMLIGNLTGLGYQSGSGGDNIIVGLISEISGSPIGGTYTSQDFISEVSGDISFQWGLGDGAMFIIYAGIIFLVAGILEIVDRKEFFQPKNPIKKEKSKKKDKVEIEPKEVNLEEKIDKEEKP